VRTTGSGGRRTARPARGGGRSRRGADAPVRRRRALPARAGTRRRRPAPRGGRASPPTTGRHRCWRRSMALASGRRSTRPCHRRPPPAAGGC
jgi:hypothetical protein